MHTKQLLYFQEICRCKSISKAAQQLYISRSSLISSINTLEEELGHPLFERTHNGITPTAFGLSVLETSHHILNLYDSLLEKASDISRNLISISGSHLPFVPAVISHYFAENEENNQFRYMEKRRCWVCKDVIDNHSEIGIISTPTSNRDIVQRYFKQNALDYHVICSGATCCLVGQQNPLCHNRAQQVSQEDLASLYRIVYNDTNPPDNEHLLQMPPVTLPYKGILYISDRSSMQNLLSDTNSYFACVSYPSKYHPPNTRMLEIADYPSTLDIIWFKKSRRKLTDITQNILLDIYSALNVTPDPKCF